MRLGNRGSTPHHRASGAAVPEADRDWAHELGVPPLRCVGEDNENEQGRSRDCGSTIDRVRGGAQRSCNSEFGGSTPSDPAGAAVTLFGRLPWAQRSFDQRRARDHQPSPPWWEGL